MKRLVPSFVFIVPLANDMEKLVLSFVQNIKKKKEVVKSCQKQGREGLLTVRVHGKLSCVSSEDGDGSPVKPERDCFSKRLTHRIVIVAVDQKEGKRGERTF